jgi:hypothetical protein
VETAEGNNSESPFSQVRFEFSKLDPTRSGSVPNTDKRIRLWCGELICMCYRIPSPGIWSRQRYTCKAWDYENSCGKFTTHYKRVLRQKLSQPHSDLTHSSRRIFSIYPCFSVYSFIHSFIHQWLYSRLLGPGVFSFIIFFTQSRSPWTSDQPVARPLPTERTTQTQNKSTHRHPWLEWDSNPRSQLWREPRQFMP